MKSTLTTEDTGSARSSSLPKIASPADCGGSKTEKILSSVKEEISDAMEIVNEGNPVGLLQQSLVKGKSEDEAQSSIQKEQSSASLVQKEVQQRAPPCDLGNKSFSSLGGKPLADGDLFWGTSERIADEIIWDLSALQDILTHAGVCSSECMDIWLHTIIVVIVIQLLLMEECVLKTPLEEIKGHMLHVRAGNILKIKSSVKK
ncbi:hypothetical protein MKX01_025530 [Papaver californicum]|nr:hypothetical protein MKX01_025530 [Papaver californicum]